MEEQPVDLTGYQRGPADTQSLRQPHDPTPGTPTETRDIAEVPAIEVITTAAVHLMSAAAVKCGLARGAGRRASTSTWTRRAG